MSAIVLFDGECNLCAATVQFILPRDPDGYFQFASLQSPTGQELLARFPLTSFVPDSVVLIDDDQIYTRSDAALRIARHLHGIWSLAYGFHFVPRALRDWVYETVAANRYRLFGRSGRCLVNVQGAQDHFLEGLSS